MSRTLGISVPSPCDSSAPAFALPAAEFQDLFNSPTIDLRLLLENCLGKPLFAVSLLEEFARTAASRVEEFEDQSQQGNLRTIAEMAHGLRGVADIFGARAVRDITIDTEAACQNGDLAQTQRLVQQLRREVQRIRQDIPHLCLKLKSQPDDQA